MNWKGVFPAITTPFAQDLSVDHDFLAKHVAWLIEQGSQGIVALGSLGEANTLTFEEKVAILRTCYLETAGKVPLVAGVASLSTREAVDLAKAADSAGCEGLMVLPPYVYRGDWVETATHYRAVIRATGLSCMLYNNPIAYGTDILPYHMAELCDEENLHAVKESSADVRRISAIKELIGGRLEIFVGVDDIIVEGVCAGATGWIAGLVNALPKESIRLFELAQKGSGAELDAYYRWFLPLLRLDVVSKFVQLIKLVQQEVGMGNARVRPPRLELQAQELDNTLELIRNHLACRPQ